MKKNSGKSEANKHEALKQPTLKILESGQGQPVVFIHGLVASHNYWNRIIDRLDNYNNYSVDLLGFGDSPKPEEATYSIDEQVDALHNSLKHQNIQYPTILVGHSMGALIAVRYAVKHPKNIKKLILCNTPLFARDTINSDIVISSDIAPRFIIKGRVAKFICMSSHHIPFIETILRNVPHKLPADIKADMLKHTWNSYSKSMENLIEVYDPTEDLATLRMPTLALLGNKDAVTSVFTATAILPPNIKTHIVKNADHHIPIFNTDELISFFKEGT
jgi:pimeloyl-ACP methyl ester carboxylesterase